VVSKVIFGALCGLEQPDHVPGSPTKKPTRYPEQLKAARKMNVPVFSTVVVGLTDHSFQEWRNWIRDLGLEIVFALGLTVVPGTVLADLMCSSLKITKEKLYQTDGIIEGYDGRELTARLHEDFYRPPALAKRIIELGWSEYSPKRRLFIALLNLLVAVGYRSSGSDSRHQIGEMTEGI